MKAKILVLAICMSLAATGAWAHGGEEHVIGTVAKVTADAIMVKTLAGKVVNVWIGQKCEFIKDTYKAEVADLAVGDRVVIHAKEQKDGGLVATNVEAASPRKGAAKLSGSAAAH